MTAPDKIYIPMTPDCDIAVNDWSGVPLSQYDRKPVTANICYIRKDALLEFIEKQSQNWSSDSITGQGVKTGLFMIKDKLESL